MFSKINFDEECLRPSGQFFCSSPLHYLEGKDEPSTRWVQCREETRWNGRILAREVRCGYCHKALFSERVEVEEVTPPREIPSFLEVKRKVRPAPQKRVPPPPEPIIGDWQMPGVGLAFKMRSGAHGFHAERKRRALLRPKEFQQRRERLSVPAFAVFVGVTVPRVNGSFKIYKRLPGEPKYRWAARLRKMLEMKEVLKEERREQWIRHAPLKQVFNYLTKTLRDENPWDVLEEQGDIEMPLLRPENRFWRAPKDRVSGCATNWSYDYIESRLALKSRLALLQDEWKEARFLRRERMRRVILIDRFSHRVRSVKADLIEAFDKLIRQNPSQFVDVPRGEQNDTSRDDHISSYFSYHEMIDWNNRHLKLVNKIPIFKEKLKCKPKFKFDPISNMRKFTENIFPMGEMENADAHGDKNKPDTDKRFNTVIEDQSKPSVTVPLPEEKEKRNEFQCMAAAPTEKKLNKVDERWIIVHQGTWSTAQQMGDVLFELEMPKYALENAVFKNSVNYALFRNHTFWRGQMEFKVVLNANPRQYGQLQMRYYYMAYADKHWDMRKNVYIGSQQPHVLLDAASSNAGILKIPFEYIFPILTISRGEQLWDSPPPMTDFANLGTLICSVLVPLRVAQTTQTTCHYTVYMSMTHNEFAGAVASSLVETKPPSGQMFSTAAMIAAAHVIQSLDNNRDNPTISHMGMPMIPVNCGSWAFGTGISEYTNVLRLDPRGTTPYPESRVPGVDEMAVNHIASIYGLIAAKTWRAQDPPGKLLFKMDASPHQENYFWPSYNVGTTRCTIMPPVSVISSLFSYWGGSLKLRMDIVGGTELSGALLVTFVPKVYGDISFTDAQCCANVTYVLKADNRQFNFLIPYCADRPMWGRNRQLKEEYYDSISPGTVYVFVLNPLTLNATIPDNCEILFYLAAAPDFEVGIPAVPTLGLGFNPKMTSGKTALNVINIKSGYSPLMVDSYFAYPYFPFYRYGTGSEHVAQFVASQPEQNVLLHIMKPQENYTDNPFQINFTNLVLPTTKGEVTVTGNISHRGILVTASSDNNIIPVAPLFPAVFNAYIICFRNTSNYTYGIFLPYLTSMGKVDTLYATTLRALRMVTNEHYQTSPTINEAVIFWTDFWGSLSAFKPFNFVDFTIAGAKAVDVSKLSFLSSNDKVFKPNERTYIYANPPTGEMGDERTTQETKPSNPQDTACTSKIRTSMLFGEKFNDLKDYCRRYQLYGRGMIKLETGDASMRRILIKFPAMPQGLDPPVKRDGNYEFYFNRVREGPIPIIASGYRFFTGSLRFRVAIDIGSTAKGKIFVSHRPDIVASKLSITHRSSVTGTDDLELPGYACYHQYDELNNVICFEVPFYLPIVRSLLQRPAETWNSMMWSSLGEIAIGVTMPTIKDSAIQYEIYYSLGDDARFSVFMGFPPMLDPTTLPPESNPNLAEELGFEDLTDIKGEMADPEEKEEEKSSFVSKLNPMNYLPAFKNVNKATENISKIDVNGINETIEESRSMIQTIKDQISSSVPTFQGIKLKIEKYMSLIVNLITNFVHCLINFNLKTIAVAIVSILTQIKLVSINVTTSLIDSLFRLFKKEHPDASDNLAEETKEILEGVGGQMDEMVDVKQMAIDDDNIRAAYVSTLVVGVAACLSQTPRLLQSNWKSVFTIIFDGIKNFSLTANAFFIFLKNNLKAIQRIGNWLISDSPQIRDIAFLEKQEKDMYDWAVKSIEICDPWKEKELFMSMAKASQVHSLCIKGNLTLLKLGKLKISNVESTILTKILDQLTRLRDRLVRAHMAPPVRFQPFVYELTGKTGTGKSELLNYIPYQLLKAMRIKTEGEVIYHRALGNAYWNNCFNQPVCSIDEKLPISKPGFDDVQLAELFQLKSRCIFNPPMADIPDKNLRYNPLIVQYGSNNPFPSLTGILDEEAVFRRRDVLIKMDFTEAILREYGEKVTMEKLRAEHRKPSIALRFCFHTNPRDKTAAWGSWMNFQDFMTALILKWKQYYRREEPMFQEHLHRAMNVITEGSDFTSFEEEWKNMVEGYTKDEQLINFSTAYQELYEARRKSHKDGKSWTIKQFREKLTRLIVSCFGTEDAKKKTDEQLVADLTTAYKSAFAVDTTNGEMHEGLIIEDNDLVAQVKICQSNDNGLCGHHILFLGEMHKQSDINYVKDKKYWLIGKGLIETFIDRVCNATDDFEIELKDFGNIRKAKSTAELSDNYSHIHELKHQFAISHISCGHSNCPFNEKRNRIKFVEDLIQNNPKLKPLNNLGTLGRLGDLVPAEYMEQLKEKATEAANESVTPEKLEEVGFLRGLYNNMKEKVMTIQWKKWFQRLAWVLGAMFIIGSIWQLWSYSLGATATGVCTYKVGKDLMGASPEAFASGDYKVGHQQKPTPRVAAVKTLEGVKGQMSQLEYTNIINKIKRNTFILSINNGEEQSFGRCLGICGRFALIPDHYYEAWKNFSVLHVTSDCNYIAASAKIPVAIKLNFNTLKYTKFSESSLGLLELPVKIPAFKDIRRLISTSSWHALGNGIGEIIEIDFEKNETCMRHVAVTYTNQPPLLAHGGKLFSNFTIGDCYKYKEFHGSGKCGSVLLCPSLSTPIIGMHVAGNKTYGFSETISQEMFMMLNSCPSAQPDTVVVGESARYIDGEVIGLGAVCAKLAHRANNKSRIIPSVIQESGSSDFPRYTELAVLNPKDPRIKDNPFSPMRKGCEHHGKPLLDFCQADIDEACEDYKNKILALCKPLVMCPQQLDVLTAVNGIDGKDLYDPLEWNSSEGFPFTAERPKNCKDKRWLFKFDKNNKVTELDPLLVNQMEYKKNLRLNNLIPETVFVDCLKDCTVDKEKVLIPGKTRIFSISPVDFTIQQRQCTLDFTAAYMANRLKLEHAIGINPDSLEWTELTSQLMSKGDNIATGDYSKFGDTIPPIFIHKFFEIMIEWYRKYGILTQEHEQQLKIMAHELANSVHLMFDFLYQVVCGQPSGNSLTVIINSFANSIYIRLAWLAAMRNHRLNSLNHLHEHVVWFSYGDDIIISLSDFIKELFNAQFLHAFFGRYNLKFTNSDKSDLIVKYSNLANADFLKRGFKMHPIRKHAPQVIMAPLKVESIEDTVHWVNSDSFGLSNQNCSNYIEMSKQVCEDALRNAYSRGPDYYENFRNKLIKFWTERGEYFSTPNWFQLDHRVFNLNEPLHPYHKRYLI